MACLGIFTITNIQDTPKRAYKRNIRVIIVSIIPYSQCILIYYIDKSAKRGVHIKILYQYDSINNILN